MGVVRFDGSRRDSTGWTRASHVVPGSHSDMIHVRRSLRPDLNPKPGFFRGVKRLLLPGVLIRYARYYCEPLPLLVAGTLPANHAIARSSDDFTF